MSTSANKQSTPVPSTVVHPATWTLARVNAERLDDLKQRIAESEARSNFLTAEVTALIAVNADAREHERQLWDTLDALQRLRLDQWVLLQAPE